MLTCASAPRRQFACRYLVLGFVRSKFAGAGAAKGNLRALNQSVSSQVALLMKNPAKLARRSGVSAEQRPRVLCQPAKPVAEPASPTGRQSAIAGPPASSAGEEEEQDLEAFDDGEFYAQLLKEFLDSSGGPAGLSGSQFDPQVLLHSNLLEWATSCPKPNLIQTLALYDPIQLQIPDM